MPFCDYNQKLMLHNVARVSFLDNLDKLCSSVELPDKCRSILWWCCNVTINQNMTKCCQNNVSFGWTTQRLLLINQPNCWDWIRLGIVGSTSKNFLYKNFRRKSRGGLALTPFVTERITSGANGSFQLITVYCCPQDEKFLFMTWHTIRA